MKKLFLLFTFITPFLLNAQSVEGEIVYEEKIKMEIDLPEDQEHLRSMIPSSQSSKKILHFTADHSLYKDWDPKDDDNYSETNSTEGNVQFKMVIMRPENLVYKDLTQQKRIEQRDFMGKKFLIKDAMLNRQWKLTGEQKMILDYPCQKAILQDSTQTIEAWFTLQIPCANGPDNYDQLPGMILEVNRNDGARHLVATEVRLTSQSADIIKAPKKGKKVDQESFDKIVDEKTKEMAEEMGGNGSIQINIRN